jgi:hypothetical protein
MCVIAYVYSRTICTIYIYITVVANFMRVIEERRLDGWDMWHVGGKLNAYRVLVRKPDRKTPLVRTRLRQEDNTKVNLKYDGMVCTRFMWLRIEAKGEPL